MTTEDSTKYEWRNGRLFLVQKHSTGRVDVVVLTQSQLLEVYRSMIGAKNEP